MLPITLDKNCIYATKGNIYAPAGSVAATIASAAQTRINDELAAFTRPDETAPTITINANKVHVAT